MKNNILFSGFRPLVILCLGCLLAFVSLCKTSFEKYKTLIYSLAILFFVFLILALIVFALRRKILEEELKEEAKQNGKRYYASKTIPVFNIATIIMVTSIWFVSTVIASEIINKSWIKIVVAIGGFVLVLLLSSLIIKIYMVLQPKKKRNKKKVQSPAEKDFDLSEQDDNNESQIE